MPSGSTRGWNPVSVQKMLHFNNLRVFYRRISLRNLRKLDCEAKPASTFAEYALDYYRTSYQIWNVLLGDAFVEYALKRGSFRLSRNYTLSFCLSMIFSENRCPLCVNAAVPVRIMLWLPANELSLALNPGGGRQHQGLRSESQQQRDQLHGQTRPNHAFAGH
jgi:hypothetical protein